MTTLELYRKHKKGEIGRDRFLYEVRRDNNLPWITNITSYDDAVKILKNKGIIRESEEDQFETTLLADLNNILKNPERAKDVLNQAKELAKKHNTTLKDLYGMMASPFGANALLSDVEPNIKKKSLAESLQKKRTGILKEAQFEPQNIPTDPLVDRVNPYALKREVEKLLAKEPELTNDSYKEALNKAAKKLTTPEAVKKAMFANADSVAKADAKLQMTPVKKNNLKDKANEMKKAKGQAMPKATAAPTKENKKTKKPKGVEVMKDKGVEGTEKVLRETVLAELQSYLKKKLSLKEDSHPDYHPGMEVHLPEGEMGKILEIIGSTCVVEMKDGSHKHLQLNVLNHAKKQAVEASENPAMAEEKVSYEKGIELADKLVDAIEMFNSLSDEEKKAQAKTLGIDMLAKLKSAHDDLMNKIHDESNYPAQEEDPNLSDLQINEIAGRDLDTRLEMLQDAQYSINQAIEKISKAVKGTSIDRNVRAYTIGHLDNWANGGNPQDMTIPKIIEILSGEDEEDLDELMLQKGTGPSAKTIVATKPSSISAATKSGFKAITGTEDVTAA